MIKIILIISALLVAGIVIGGQLMPTKLSVERSTVIGASKLAVFEAVSNLDNFNKFSPWHDIDPNTRYEYSDKRSGVGATMKWFSEHKDVGNGKQRVTKVIGAERIEMELEFDSWDGVSSSWYDIAEVANGTQVTWGYSGDVSKPFFIRFLSPMIKGQLETAYDNGLSNLKALLENKSGGLAPPTPAKPMVPPVITHETVQAQTIVYTRGRSSFASNDIAQNLAKAYQQVMTFINTHSITTAGMPLALDTSESNPPALYVFEAGIPVADDTPEFLANETIGIKKTYAGQVIKAIHTGPYTQLPKVYEAVDAFIGENQISTSGPSWEHYVSDPGHVAEDELITHIFVPVN